MILYVETSAAAKLLVDEPASGRLAARLDDAVAQDGAVLSSMVANDRSLYGEAGLLPGRHLRSHDALHLAAALRAAPTSW